MADHDHTAGRLAQADEVDGFARASRKWFLDQHVLAGPQRIRGNRVMGVDGGRDDDRFDVRLEQLRVAAEERDLRVAGADVLQSFRLAVRHSDQLDVGHLVQVADQLRSPVTAADDADPGPMPIGAGDVALVVLVDDRFA